MLVGGVILERDSTGLSFWSWSWKFSSFVLKWVELIFRKKRRKKKKKCGCSDGGVA